MTDSSQPSLTSRVSGGMVWNFLGKTISTGLSFALMILVARWLSPEDFGAYSVIMALFSAVLLATSLGLDVGLLKYLPEYRSRNETGFAQELVSSALAAKFLLLLIAGGLLVGCTGFLLGRLFGGLHLEKACLYMLPVILLPCGLNVLFRSLLESNYQQRLLNVVDVVQVITRLSLTVLLLVLEHGILGVLIASAVMEWGALAFFVFVTRSGVPLSRCGLTPRTRKLISFSLSMWVMNFAAFMMGKSSDLLLLGMFTDSHVAGLYNVAYTFSSQAYMFMTLPLGNLVLVAASELYGGRDEQRLVRMSELLLKYHLLFVPALCVGGIILAEPIIRCLYGESYLGATLLLQLYMVIFAINIVFSGPFTTLLQSMEQQRALMLSSIVLGFLNLFLNLFLVPRFGALGALAGTGIVQVVSVTWLGLLLRRQVPWQFPRHFGWKATVAGVGMGAFLFWARGCATSFPTLLIVIVAGAIVYGVVLKLTRPFAESDLALLRNSRIPGTTLFLRFLRPA